MGADTAGRSSKVRKRSEKGQKKVSIPMVEQQEMATIEYCGYKDESELPSIVKLIDKDLSEPYSIFTYRFFIHNWPELCILARCEQGQVIGAIVGRLERTKGKLRGYIAMLAVDTEFRGHGIGSTLAKRVIDSMIAQNCDEVVLETEITNKGALRLYGNLGFAKDKRLSKYYLNGVDAFRLKLYLK